MTETQERPSGAATGDGPVVVIPEPIGGAHRDPEETARRVKETVQRHLKALIGLPKQELLDRRLEKYLKMGVYLEETTAVGATQES